ncbi:FAD-binding protein [Pseudonocardia sp. DSM 110487]|uniref:FAD-dependent oxidoreductase n=1 Tax=Pseudonocardia sp. DSM 110487 TaxID=2865833 RepID=UPI001C6A0C2C|nr:FAD-binding protein [Pseudonocardia sp. DSM 110487]QYN39040.1 FAD-binding protein [Pseudonocardia sp. DSM 110487]
MAAASEVDLLVVGGGMAGLTAAARAALLGARVLLVERGPTLGGSGIYAGFIWTAPTHEVMGEVNPEGDPALRAALVDGFAGAVEWIRSLGVECRDAVPVLRYGRGHQLDTGQYIGLCERIVRERGEVLTEADTTDLLSEGGAVTGGVVRLAGGTRTVRAGATLLATGGFQADPALRAELIHPAARDVELRSNPGSRGDGLRLARSVGVEVEPDGAGFYGHLIPAGVSLSDPALFVDLALYYSEHALLFNLAGERFVDETVGDHLTTSALMAQPEARGLLVADARVYREWITGSYVAGIPGIDKFALARRRGARCAIAESTAEFADMPEEWGYDGARIGAAIDEINKSGRAPDPDRRYDPAPLTEPPFYVVEARPAVTFPFTGLRIDVHTRVLGADGRPVPGLYAAGADAGGLYRGAYAGGVAPAVVFGLAAADAVAGAHV